MRHDVHNDGQQAKENGELCNAYDPKLPGSGSHSQGHTLFTGLFPVVGRFTAVAIRKQTDALGDMAIMGEGFFRVQNMDGTWGYTRDGSFGLDADGNMVNASGYPLEPAITVPANTLSVTIGSDGVVSAMVAGNTTPTQIGSIELALSQPVLEGIEAIHGAYPNPSP